MRVNHSTFAKLCLLTALAIPIQRSAFATAAQGARGVDTTQSLIAQDSETLEPTPTATSLEENLTAMADANSLVIIENAASEVVAGPLSESGPITTLALSNNGEILATGTQTGQVRFWNTDGKPRGDLFQPVVGDDSAIAELRFEDDETLYVGASQGRQDLWGLDGLPPSSTVIGQAETPSVEPDADTTEVEVEGTPWWVWPTSLIGILGLGWLFLGRRRSQADATEARRQTSPTATVQPPVTDLENDREVSNRAQTIVLTDRGVDESRSDLPMVSSPEAEALSLHESNDLESSPDLEGTNLDLSVASMVSEEVVLGGAASEGAGLDGTGLDGNAILDDETLDNQVEAGLEDDPWDDELELTLDDAESAETTPVELAESILVSSLEQEPTVSPAIEMPAIETSIDDTASVEQPLEAPAIPVSPVALETPLAEVPVATDISSISTSSDDNDASGIDASGIDAVEPTRDTVIAEIETVPDIEPNRETIIGDHTVIYDGGLAATTDVSNLEALPDTAAKEAEVLTSRVERLPWAIEDLASVDNGLADLPEGYGESRIVLLPRDPEWAYAYWDVSNEHKEKLRQQGGQRLMLRLYDVTDLDMTSQAPHSMQQVDCHEMARSWYLEMPVSDRDYLSEIGYLTADDRWLLLARSAPIRVPPIYPSGWVKDQFVSLDWQEQLGNRSFGDLGQPYSLEPTEPAPVGEAPDLPRIYDNLFTLTQRQEALRVAGSLYGSMQRAPSGGPGGLERSIGPLGLSASGLNTSGLTMSGIGSGGSVLPERSRKFWLVADAELIVYGATEPDATLTIGDKVIPLNPDGTFRFHIAFPDGQIDYPIRAVAADGEQTRAVHLHFERATPERNTNPKDEAEDEWF